jgi:hypothetical protein
MVFPVDETNHATESSTLSTHTDGFFTVPHREEDGKGSAQLS